MLDIKSEELGKGTLDMKKTMLWLILAPNLKVFGECEMLTCISSVLQYAANCGSPTMILEAPEFKQYPPKISLLTLLLLSRKVFGIFTINVDLLNKMLESCFGTFVV